MRVSLVVDSIDRTGGFRVAATLGQLLQQRGHAVCVFAPQPQRFGLLARIKAGLQGRRISNQSIGNEFVGSLPVVYADHPAPLNAADLADADIVIATWWKTMRCVSQLPAEKGVKVHLVQDYEAWPPHDPAVVDRLLRFKCPKIAISGYLYRLLCEEFASEQVYLLPNAVNHDLFFAAERSKGHPVTVGFIYTADPRKGSDLIIKAVTRARAACPDLQVVAFSHHDPDPSIPVPPWIDFHVSPAQDRIRQLYSSCDAWLFGSRQEGFGLPILEAMACRTPVIGMPAGAAPELLGDGAGILVGDQDWQAMAQAILDVQAMSDAGWQDLSQRAHARALENQWDIIGDRLDAILTELIA